MTTALLSAALLTAPASASPTIAATANGPQPVAQLAVPASYDWSGAVKFAITRDLNPSSPNYDGCTTAQGHGTFTYPVEGSTSFGVTSIHHAYDSRFAIIPPTGSYSENSDDRCARAKTTEQTTGPSSGFNPADADMGGSGTVDPDGTLHYKWEVSYSIAWATAYTRTYDNGTSFSGTVDPGILFSRIVPFPSFSGTLGPRDMTIQRTLRYVSRAQPDVTVDITVDLTRMLCSARAAICPSVVLDVAAARVSLLRPDKLTAVVTPRSARVSSYRFEWKRSTDATWTKLVSRSRKVYTLKPKIAGHLMLRVVAVVNNYPIASDPKPLEVRFPAWGKIFRNPTVRGFAARAWKATLATATPKSRGERCFWIRLKTRNGRYLKTRTIVTKMQPNQTGYCSLPAPPPDQPPNPPVTAKPVYTVAWFHTHTPTTFLTWGRQVGPSQADIIVSNFHKMPGTAYDYIGKMGSGGNSHIPKKWPLGKPARLWQVPSLDFRPTPP